MASIRRFALIGSTLIFTWLISFSGVASARVKVDLDHIDVTRAPVFHVYVDYMNEANRPIRGLEPKDVSILIDGEKWDDEFTVTPFSKSEEGAAFVLLVSNYRGFSMAFEAQKKGLIEFTRGLRPKDVAAVYSYADSVNPLVDFTSDKDELAAAIRTVPSPEKPVNVFLDAIIAGLEAFPDQEPGFPRRRGIVMMGDGLDQNLDDRRGIAQRLKKELAPKARALGVKFYSLGYTIESNDGLTIMKTFKKKLGGSFRQVRESELNRSNQFFREILDRVHGQYILTFNTDDLDSDERHTIQVNINHQGNPIESIPVEFQPPPVEGTPWWVYVLWFLGIVLGIGLLVVIIQAIINREPAAPVQVQEERELPVWIDPDGDAIEAERASPSIGHAGQLVMIGSGWDGLICPLVGESVCLGSREGEILIPDASVSGKHARILVDDMKFELSDLGSTNGTYVNGKRISKQFLKAGDVLKCGHVEMKFALNK